MDDMEYTKIYKRAYSVFYRYRGHTSAQGNQMGGLRSRLRQLYSWLGVIKRGPMGEPRRCDTTEEKAKSGSPCFS